MPQAFRNTLLTLRDLIVSAGPLAFLALGLLVAAYWWLNPNPPNQVTLATGPAQSAYEEFGKRYQKALAADGIEVLLLPSEGHRPTCSCCARARPIWPLCRAAPQSCSRTTLISWCRWAAFLSSRSGCSIVRMPA